jgi:RimJ/RimL family protein N-acetyltransferase
MANVGFRKEAEKIGAKWHDGQMKDRLEYAINQNEFMSRS